MPEVLNHLDSIEGGKCLSMKITYLQHLIQVEKNIDSELHNQLVLFLLKYVQLDNANKEEFTVEDISGRLKSFLSGSKHYNPEKMLSKFPFDSLLEERAILLSRINRHGQALNIYVSKLKRTDLAEAYCMEHHDPSSTNEESRDIWITLIKMFMAPSQNEQPNIKGAMDILERQYEKIDVLKALRLLPTSVTVSDLQKFFESVIRKQTEKRRSTQVAKQLARSENLQVQEKFINERKRSIKIKQARACPVCKKKIGLSAFACYPNGIVVHYVCSKQPFICPVTGKNFEKDTKFEDL